MNQENYHQHNREYASLNQSLIHLSKSSKPPFEVYFDGEFFLYANKSAMTIESDFNDNNAKVSLCFYRITNETSIKNLEPQIVINFHSENVLINGAPEIRWRLNPNQIPQPTDRSAKYLYQQFINYIQNHQ